MRLPMIWMLSSVGRPEPRSPQQSVGAPSTAAAKFTPQGAMRGIYCASKSMLWAIAIGLLVALSACASMEEEEDLTPWTFKDVPADVMAIASNGNQKEYRFILYSATKFRPQPYRFRVSGTSKATLRIGKKTFKLKKEESGDLVAIVKTHQIPSGFNECVVHGGAEDDVRIAVAHCGDMLFFKEIPESEKADRNVNTWQSMPLSNGLVTAEVALPDVDKGIYRGRRFEQAGIITKLRYQGHQYFSEVNGRNEPLNDHWGISTVSEFREAIGWRDAKLGEPFIKIGVGLFRRTGLPKFKWYEKNYIVKRVPWKTVRKSDGCIEFSQSVKLNEKWGYEYTKTVTLVPGKPVLQFSHRLKNIGTETIETTHYIHNWITLDRKECGPGYKLKLRYEPTVQDKSADQFTVIGDTISPKASKSAFTELYGWEEEPLKSNYGVISCAETKAFITVQGDFPTASQALYCGGNTVCYEPFKGICLDVGEVVSWTLEYTFGEQ